MRRSKKKEERQGERETGSDEERAGGKGKKMEEKVTAAAFQCSLHVIKEVKDIRESKLQGKNKNKYKRNPAQRIRDKRQEDNGEARIRVIRCVE